MEQSKCCAQEKEEEEEKREERVFSRTNITKQNTTNYNLDGTKMLIIIHHVNLSRLLKIESSLFK
jgi:hypothetical protein